MDKVFFHMTRGICPICRQLVDAKLYGLDGNVYLEKDCLQHGLHTALISSDQNYYLQTQQYLRAGKRQQHYFSDRKNGCPDDCGLCPDHEQHICMPILEITADCNLSCPICIAAEHQRQELSLDDVKAIVARLLEAEKQIDLLNVSGGEPTLHPQYRAIMDYLVSVDAIVKVSVSTNGLRFLEDEDLLDFHQQRAIIISLQLDGGRREVYTRLRGADLMARKERLLAKLIERDMDFSLIATIGRGINDTPEDFRYLYRLLTRHDNVISLLCQPLVHAGRLRNVHDVMARVTIPDVIRLVAAVSDGAVREEDFIPLPCCDSGCFALVHLLSGRDGRYVPIRRFVDPERYVDLIKNRSFFGSDEESFYEIRDALFDIWAASPGMCACQRESAEDALRSIRSIIKDVHSATMASGCFSPRRSFDIASRRIKSVFIHHFMDADTFDLSRARRCCTVYPKPDGKFYPVCTYNNLYRDRHR